MNGIGADQKILGIVALVVTNLVLQSLCQLKLVIKTSYKRNSTLGELHCFASLRDVPLEPTYLASALEMEHSCQRLPRLVLVKDANACWGTKYTLYGRIGRQRQNR